MTRVGLAALLFIGALSGCHDHRDERAPKHDAAVPATAFALPVADGKKLVVDNCLMCHRREMLEQQRLTMAQWTSVVKKMSGWGSPIEPDDMPALVAYLAANYNPDAAAFVPVAVPVEEAAAQLATLEDGPFAGGDVTRGRAFFVSTCSPCHGANAKGQVGVNLVDRPILYRAADVATMVREGRGRMLPVKGVTDAQIGDVVAYLRGL